MTTKIKTGIVLTLKQRIPDDLKELARINIQICSPSQGHCLGFLAAHSL